MKFAHWMLVSALCVALTFSSLTACAPAGQNDRIEFRLSDCGDLQNLQVPASLIGLPTSGAVVKTATPVDATAKDNSEFCKVIGSIKPVNPQSPDIEFEVNLPTSWNGRALQMGGGGYNGTLVDGLTGYSLQPSNDETPLKKGYVTLGTGIQFWIVDLNLAFFTRETGTFLNSLANPGLTFELAFRQRPPGRRRSDRIKMKDEDKPPEDQPADEASADSE